MISVSAASDKAKAIPTRMGSPMMRWSATTRLSLHLTPAIAHGVPGQSANLRKCRMPARTRPDLQMSKPDRRRATPPGNKSSRLRQPAQYYQPIAEYYWQRLAAVGYVLVDLQACHRYFFIRPAFHLSRRNTN